MTQTEFFKHVGIELKVSRIRIEKSTTDIAKLTGLSVGCIQDIERGATDPKLSTLKRYADALGVSLKEVM